MSSERQINANRENGKLSHGAITDEGRNICKMNALKHGLTGATILLPDDDLSAYQKSVAIVFDHYQPVTDIEKLAIQEVADTKWRLLRIPILESGIFAKGRMENRYLFHAEVIDPQDRHVVVEGEIQHTYTKTLSNLTLQQSRLQRHLERKIKEFNELRAEREAVQQAHINIAMNSLTGDPEDMSPPHPSVGVVFSIEFLVARLEFERAMPDTDIAIFDRAWRDKKAKTPA
jgi:hypothetical protein